jgi:non-heme chloroperoxidase
VIAEGAFDLVEALDLNDVTFVGHSMGGETVRYIACHGESRVAKAALVGAVTPFLPKTTTNPNRVLIEVFDGVRAAVQAEADRSQWNKDVTVPYYGFNRSDAVVSEACARSTGVRAWRPGSCLL